MSELAAVDATDLGDARLVRLTGEIDLSNVGALLAAIGDAVPTDASLVIVDLSHTSYVDSAGVAMLFRLAERLHDSRQELRLVVPPDASIRVALELTKLHRVVPVHRTVGEVRASQSAAWPDAEPAGA